MRIILVSIGREFFANTLVGLVITFFASLSLFGLMQAMGFTDITLIGVMESLIKVLAALLILVTSAEIIAVLLWISYFGWTVDQIATLFRFLPPLRVLFVGSERRDRLLNMVRKYGGKGEQFYW